MNKLARLSIASVVFLTAVWAGWAGARIRAAEADVVAFGGSLAPMLLEKCVACHGPKKAEGSYRADTFERLMTAGDSGLAPFTAGKVDDSEVLRRMSSADSSERMPLDGDPLPADQVALVRRWIEEGAKFDGPDPKVDLAMLVSPPTYPDPPEAYPAVLPITALAFAPDGRQLMVGGYHELTVWNPEDGTLVRRIKNIAARTYALAFSPDGTKLAVACGSPGRRGEVRLLDAATGNLLTVLAPSGDVVLDVAFSPDGSRIAAVGADGVLRVFHVETSAAQLATPAHADWITAVAWSGDGRLLATASRDKSAKVFDAASGEPRVTYAGHEQVVSGVIFHPDGQQLYSGGADNKVHLWSVADGKKAADIPGAGGEACKLARGGTFLLAAAADRSVRQLDLGTRSQVRAFSGHGETVLSIAVHEGGKRVAAGAFDGTIRVWNLEDGKPISQFTAAPGYASRR
jgi:hypothetical protein